MTEEAPKVTLSNALLCDDVRREDNGKDILIGVYTGKVLVSKMPANLVVALWIVTKTKGAGSFEREVRVVGPDKKTIAEGRFRAVIVKEDEGYASFALSKVPLNMNRTGEIKFQWKKPMGRWVTLLTKEVEINPHSEEVAT
jgi:hypothetical protein